MSSVVQRLKDHPSNTARSAKLIRERAPMVWVGKEIYQVPDGYVVCVSTDTCLYGHYKTKAEAITAQDAYFAETRRRV